MTPITPDASATHHGAKNIRIAHGVARLLDLDALGAANQLVALREILPLFTVFGSRMRTPSSDTFNSSATF